MSDHGLEQCYASPCSPSEASVIFDRLAKGRPLEPAEIEKWRSFLMLEFAKWNYERGWTMQLHLGAIRNNNTRMFTAIGADTGCDSIGDFAHAERTNAFLDTLDQRGHLPKVILFNSNPRDNLLFATIAGNFFEDGVAGKIQYGPAWWFLDTYEGMKAQLDALSQVGLFRNFIGMVTDSRSFLSFTRHEYFRRLMCQMLADDMASGRMPKSVERARALLRAICYDNPRALFSRDTAC
jgi:glucuronate isomerase